VVGSKEVRLKQNKNLNIKITKGREDWSYNKSYLKVKKRYKQNLKNLKI